MNFHYGCGFIRIEKWVWDKGEHFSATVIGSVGSAAGVYLMRRKGILIRHRSPRDVSHLPGESVSEVHDYAEIRNFLKAPVILFPCPRLCTNTTIGFVYGESAGATETGYLAVPD